tara:strand:- start:25162 stop:26631 length:1470 start_codon:yes stop_codon:yes gene_type:complete
MNIKNNIESLDPLFVLKEHFKVISDNIKSYRPKTSAFKLQGNKVVLEQSISSYLYTDRIQQDVKPNSTILIGESIARCYGYDPKLNFANLISDDKLIDLSKIGLSIFELFDILPVVRDINPKKIIFMVGNNKIEFNFFNEFVLSFLERKYGDPYLVFENLLHHFYYETVLEKISTLLDNPKIELLFCVPMGNTFTRLSQREQKESTKNLGFSYERSLPGIGTTHINAFEKTLNKAGYNFISLRDFLNSREDFIDYCHLSISGIEKTLSKLNESFSIQVNAFENIESDMAEIVEDFFDLYINPHHSHIKTKVVDLFCGKPLAQKSLYWDLMKDIRFKKCFDFLNPKDFLPTSIQNTISIAENNNLLSKEFSSTFYKASFNNKYSYQYFPEISDDKSSVYFYSEKMIGFLEISIIPYLEDINLGVRLNGKQIGCISDNNLGQEIQVEEGLNKLEIYVMNDKIEFPASEIIKYILYREKRLSLYKINRLSIS